MPEIYLEEGLPNSPHDLERKKGVITAAKLMFNAAVTAPKSGGMPGVEGYLVYGQDELEKIARKMNELASYNDDPNWKRMFKYEAVMVRECDVVLFLGATKGLRPFDNGCNQCGGHGNCQWFYERRNAHYGHVDQYEVLHPDRLVDGPLCTVNITNNFGWSVGSALIMAKRLLVDTRPFMSVGVAGQKLGYCPKSKLVVGIPVAATSKDPFVDVLADYHLNNMSEAIESVRSRVVIGRGIMGDYRSWDPLDEKKDEKE